MSATELEPEQQQRLLQLARESIAHGLETHRAWVPDVSAYPQPLREPRATFVTIKRQGVLRGCIGTLEPHQSLAEDVAEHAYAAAFSDPRFPPLTAEEFAGLDVSISILSPPEEIAFTDEGDLLRQIRAGIDGLIIQEGQRRGTFLPSVWESLPDKAEFLAHLKQKAGLPMDYWSESLRVWRYTAESIGEE